MDKFYKNDSPKFYKNNREFVEEAIENLKEESGEMHDIQYWASYIYTSAKKLINYFKHNPKEATHEILSGLPIAKKYSYWDNSCGGIMTTGHHQLVVVELIKCEEIIKSCQKYLDKHKEA